MRIRARAGVAIAGLWLVLPPAWAQQNPAMENPSVLQPQSGPALSPGANSFSEGQARDLLKHGVLASFLAPLLRADLALEPEAFAALGIELRLATH